MPYKITKAINKGKVVKQWEIKKKERNFLLSLNRISNNHNSEKIKIWNFLWIKNKPINPINQYNQS